MLQRDDVWISIYICVNKFLIIFRLHISAEDYFFVEQSSLDKIYMAY